MTQPGWQPQPRPPQLPPSPYVDPSGWWYDGHKWRPPVGPQPTRWELIAQVPGALIKLFFLLALLALIIAFLVGL